MQLDLSRSQSLTLTADLVVRVRMSNPQALVDYLTSKGIEVDDLLEFCVKRAREAIPLGVTDLGKLPQWKDCPKNLLIFSVEEVDIFHVSSNLPDEEGHYQSRLRYGRSK